MYWIFEFDRGERVATWAQPSWVDELDTVADQPLEYDLLYEDDLSLMVAARTEAPDSPPVADSAVVATQAPSRRTKGERRQACQKVR